MEIDLQLVDINGGIQMAIKDRGNITGAMKGGAVDVSDVFSTYVYTGNGTTQDIVNGIDLATEGGMVWIKARNATTGHFLVDTVRGVNKGVYTDRTNAQGTYTDSVTTFNSNGFSMGPDTETNWININLQTHASWTFRKAPRFFDMVKYTGNGVAGREIAHELGCDIGMCVIKDTSTANAWYVYHKSLGYTTGLLLNGTNASGGGFQSINASTDTTITVEQAWTNVNGSEYIAYLFAHSPVAD